MVLYSNPKHSFSHSKMAYNLKSEAYTYDFTSIILMEPVGIPLKTMDELFNVYAAGIGDGVSGQNILNAPEASGTDFQAVEEIRKMKIPRCFGAFISHKYWFFGYLFRYAL